MANTRIGRTVSSAGSRRKATFSAWIKRAKLGESWIAKFGGTYAQGNMLQIGFNSADNCFIVADGNTPRMECTRQFKDTNAWYHYVVAFDTEQSTASNRLKFYINGELITDYGTATYPTLNQDLNINMTGSYNNAWLGGRGESTYEFNGIMSHVHWCDGYVYDASAFGSTDSTTGEWKINTSPNVQYGTNGFFMLKDGNSLTDASGNGNNFSSLVGTLTKTEDCPSNVFCTMNPLDKSSSLNLSYGNTRTASPSNSWMPCKATIGMMGQNGKFYWEGKCESGTNHYFGVYDASGTVRGSVQSEMDANRFVYVYHGGMERTITGQSAIASGTYATFANNDIIGVGLDKENGTITFWKNGTQIYTETHSSLQTKDLIPGTQAYGSDIQWNFGNGYFGTTAVSSAGTNASGNGIFEYDVPTGYTALSTKGLNL